MKMDIEEARRTLTRSCSEGEGLLLPVFKRTGELAPAAVARVIQALAVVAADFSVRQTLPPEPVFAVIQIESTLRNYIETPSFLRIADHVKPCAEAVLSTLYHIARGVDYDTIFGGLYELVLYFPDESGFAFLAPSIANQIRTILSCDAEVIEANAEELDRMIAAIVRLAAMDAGARGHLAQIPPESLPLDARNRLRQARLPDPL
jgi:hypothetical protein